jgi:AraC-like DNA-binding protein
VLTRSSMLEHDEAPLLTVFEEERKVVAALPMAVLVFGLSQGVIPEQLCRAAGVAPSQLLDRDRFVPHAWYFGLLDALSALRPGLPVGIAFGRFITPDHFGYAGQVFRNASNGLDALRKLVRFGCLFDTYLSRLPKQMDVDDRVVRMFGVKEIAEDRIECIEAAFFSLVTQLNALTDAPVRVLEVHIHLTDERHRALYEEFFDCPIYFDAEHDGLVLARDSLLSPLRGANLAAAERIEAYVAETYGTPDEAFEARLRVVLRDQLRNAAFSQREAARALGLGVRTLERRISRQGTSFGELVEGLRRSEAQRLLSQTPAPIYEIAFCLGYQDVSSFNRAFRRWLGTSPRAYRERAGGLVSAGEHAPQREA